MNEQVKAASFVNALDQYLAAREAVKDGGGEVSSRRAYLVAMTAALLNDRGDGK
jgi:hypothetical protein